MSVEAHAYLTSLFRGNTSEMSALDWLAKRFQSLKASGRIEKDDKSGSHGDRSSVFVRRNRPVGRVAVAPVWQGLSLIRDELSGASAGTVAVTADMLVGGVAFLRSAAFATFSVASTPKS